MIGLGEGNYLMAGPGSRAPLFLSLVRVVIAVAKHQNTNWALVCCICFGYR